MKRVESPVGGRIKKDCPMAFWIIAMLTLACVVGVAERTDAGIAAYDAARTTAGTVAWDAVWDAALFARMLACIGLEIDTKHTNHLNKRMEVWRKGYALLCDVNGVLYVYAKKKKKL